ncbi:tetratricopeptide repeat protein [Holospora curviuscula]|uniref:Tetratricopeptide repeat protein n=1 Tax=Holospora curviuscula TaxID=1082868 RepID=A0A2S5R6V8_9PROT|nr:tetratricopeptide repeat protein [Holospora curviuscula]PPE03023.1 hypothetical protein HCUR_01533 [Holospora curviuscula]
MIILRFFSLCLYGLFSFSANSAPLPSPIEVVLHRLGELEDRCKALEEQCLNLQQSLDTLRGQKNLNVASKEAQEEFDQQLFTFSPSDPASNSKNLSDVTRYLKDGETNRAITLLDYFIHKNHHPLKAQALYYKGLIFMHQKKYDQADGVFSTAYLYLKTQSKTLIPTTKIQQERKDLFPIQILLRSAECLRCLGRPSEAMFVCEEIKRNLHKIPVHYHKKITEKLQLIMAPLKDKYPNSLKGKSR